MHTDSRLQGLENWLRQLGYSDIQLQSASSDASTRRYYRLKTKTDSLIAVDTPQPIAENQAFIDIGHALHSAGLNAPTIYHCDVDQGWMLLEDFGSKTFAQAIQDQSTQPALYRQASALIAEIQGSPSLQSFSKTLPLYSSTMVAQELEIFSEWCLQGHLNINLSDKDNDDLEQLTLLLVRSFAEQPQSFVHRDFHSRNLMLLDNQDIGLLDFQGAVRGPITYDWVSLLRDCYHALPSEEVQSLLHSSIDRAKREGLSSHPQEQIERWFDYTGLQRHLKAIGIFCRLKKRDNKSSYMADIPRTFSYVQEAIDKHPELVPLRRLVKTHDLANKLC